MAAALLFKSGCGLLMQNILATKNFSHQWPHLQAKSCGLFSNGQANLNLWVRATEGEMKNSRTTTLGIFYQSFLVSYPLKVTVSPPENHQVFINYRGEEVGHIFVSHLINAFERNGIKFFVDKDEQRGKDLTNLFVRIEESRIGLAIFSTRYPQLKWCMDELLKMKTHADKGKLEIIPVFYKVEPSDVRKPTSESEFSKNFWRLMEASDRRDPIHEWREALECISNKMGLSLKDNSSEADFVKKIVKEVERVKEAIGLEKEENYGGKIKEKFRELQCPRLRIFRFQKVFLGSVF